MPDGKPRVQLDWDRPPEEFFFAPGVDPGLWTLAPLPEMWSKTAKGRIAAAAVSEYAKFADPIESHIDTHFKRRSFRSGIVLETVPVVLESLRTNGHFLEVKGKYLLTGAAGTRLRNRYHWYNDGTRDADGDTIAYFDSLQKSDPVPPVWDSDTTDLDFVIDARNGFNFYHFATETLGQLALVDHDGFTGHVYIHCDRDEVKPFIAAWVDAIYPRLRGRVEFRSGQHAYDRCLSALNARHLWYQSGPTVMDGLDAEAPDTHYWKGREADRMGLMVLAMNSADAMLLRLRETALKLIEGQDWSHLPRRFWVGRKSNRVRPMWGEDALADALAERGFKTVYFEDYTPLEQVALMANAEVMMSYHGAGFANMLFAHPDTHCIEIGTLQTCLHRWQDFMPHTLVSGCRYTSLFADFNVDDPAEGPPIASRPLHAVRLGDGGRARVLDYVDAILGYVTIPDEDWLARIAQCLGRTGDTDALQRLLEAHPQQVMANPDLMILRANIYLDEGDERSARTLLERAWEATGDRPFLLERLILLYDRAGLPAPWAELHRDRYPKRAGVLGRKLRQQRRRTQKT